MSAAGSERQPQPPNGQTGLRHLSGSILSVGASRAVSLVVIALTSVVIARMLGPEGLGAFAIAQAVLLVFTFAFELGLPQAVAYHAGRGEWGGRSLLLGLTASCVALSLPGCAAMLGGYALFSDAIPEITWPMAIALAIALPFSLLWRIGPQAALGQERFGTFALLDASPAAFILPASVIGAVLADTEGAVIGAALAVIGGGACTVAWLALSARRARSASPSGGTRAVLEFGLPAWGSELLMQLNLRIDLLLVGLYLGAADGGIYSVALSTTSIAWTLMAAFAISALPRSARLQAQTESGLLTPGERDDKDARTMRHAVLTAPPVAAGVILLLALGIPLFYGSAFDRSIEFGLILAPGSLALGIGMTAVAILLGRGHTRRVLLIGVAIVPATVLAYLFAIPAGGTAAAAIVSSASYLAFTVLAIAQLRAVTDLTPRAMLLPRTADAGEYRDVAARGMARLRHPLN